MSASGSGLEGSSVPAPFRQAVEPIGFGNEAAFSLHIEDGMFTFYTSEYDDSYDAPNPDMDFSRLITAHGPWGAFMTTGDQDHIADVVLAVASDAPPAPAWAEASDSAQVTLGDSQLTIASLYFHSYGRWTLPEQGEWKVRVSKRGGDRRNTWESTATGPREEWLLQFWPAS